MYIHTKKEFPFDAKIDVAKYSRDFKEVMD